MALLTIDEGKLDQYLKEFRDLDAENDYSEITEPLWARAELDNSDLRHMVDKAEQEEVIHSLRPDISVKIFFEVDIDMDEYASLALFIDNGANHWPSVNSTSQRVRSWLGEESVTWEDAARHMVAEVVRVSNITFVRTARMVREFPAAFPDA